MVSDRVRAVLQTLGAAGAGAAAMLAAVQGLYATALLGLLIAAWIAVQSMVDASRRIVVPPPPPPPAALPDEEERRRLIAYLDLSPAPLVALDERGRLSAVNRAARHLFGRNDVVPEPPAALIAALTAPGPPGTATIELSDTGEPRNYVLATGDLALSGRMIRIGALIDIDAELKAAEATALRELVQVLSHEIVNALTPIASLAETAVAMLDDPVPALPEIRDALSIVARRAASLHRFGESYRSLARLPAPLLQRIAVPRLVDDLATLFATRWPTIALVAETSSAPAYIVADPDQLTAALWAVLQNAAEVQHDTQAPQVTLSVRALLNKTLITIADKGPGMSEPVQAEIFRPFFTTKAEGTGIGLALGRQILRSHKGDLSLASSSPTGSRFEAIIPSLLLPNQEEQATAPRVPAPTEVPPP